MLYYVCRDVFESMLKKLPAIWPSAEQITTQHSYDLLQIQHYWGKMCQLRQIKHRLIRPCGQKGSFLRRIYYPQS